MTPARRTPSARPALPPESPPVRLPDFALADQFGRELGQETYAGVPVVLVAGDREGAPGVALWTAALRAVIGGGDIGVLPIADLRGVPRVLRRMVRRLLPTDPDHWCAIDWDGQLGALVRGAHGPLVAAAYGRDRALRTWEVLPLDTVESGIMVRLVEQAAS